MMSLIDGLEEQICILGRRLVLEGYQHALVSLRLILAPVHARDEDAVTLEECRLQDVLFDFLEEGERLCVNLEEV